MFETDLKIEAKRFEKIPGVCKCKCEKLGSLFRAHNSWIALRGNAKTKLKKKSKKIARAILLDSNTLGVRIIKTIKKTYISTDQQCFPPATIITSQYYSS